MNAEIITIGDEILIGQIVDTNSAWLSAQLTQLGINVLRKTSVSDKENEIQKIFNEANIRSELVLITGGLGPTRDDKTKKAICQYFETKLVHHPAVFEDVKAFIYARGGLMNDLNKAQADVPANATIFRNLIGTAPGILLEKDNTIYIFMPGVPHEMKDITTRCVIPFLEKKITGNKAIYQTIVLQGISEALLADKLAGFEDDMPIGATLAYLPSPGYIRLRVGLLQHDKEQMESLITRLKKELTEYFIGEEDKKPEELLSTMLLKLKVSVSVAESCSGGYLSHLLTTVPGSSNYYKGGIIAYSNAIKVEILGVEENVLEAYGAVSSQTVEQMAVGALKLMKTNYAIAISGIAGPEGGTADKPVGTVWIAVASEKKCIKEKFIYGNERERTIIRSSYSALHMLRKLIMQENQASA